MSYRNTNWLTINPINIWHGISVDAQGCVSHIILGSNAGGGDTTSNHLVGTLPASLGNLANLQYLCLPNSALRGAIPATFGQLSNLIKLSLYNNQLDSSLPSSLSGMSHLQQLWLANNRLIGNIPSSLGNLTNLIQLWLRNNQFNGTIPKELGRLTQLSYFNLAKNRLTGNIPDSLGNLVHLNLLFSLGDNQLTSIIPASIGNLRKVQQISLYGNQLTGSLPTTFQRLDSLKYLYVFSNKIDSLPNLSGLSQLTIFQADTNRLTFKDILPNLVRGITYTQQDSLFRTRTYRQNAGSTVSIPLGIDSALTSNVYKWYKNDTLYKIDSLNYLNINPLYLRDAGNYKCVVTNPNAPNLTLFTGNAQVQVICPPISVNRLQATICDGSYYTLPSSRRVDLTGVYMDTLRSWLGCDSIITELTLRVNPLRYDVRLLPQRNLCQGDSLVINNQIVRTTGVLTVAASGGVAPYAYRWSNTQITSSISNLRAGTYTVTITDAQGCTFVKTDSITQPNEIRRTVSRTICKGSWANHDTTGVYTDVLRAWNGCDSIVTTNLTVIMPITISTSMIRQPSSCVVNGSARVNIVGGMAGYRYKISWSNLLRDTTPIIVNQAAGVYTVSVIDTTVCNRTLTASVTLTAPIVKDSIFNKVLCKGQTLKLHWNWDTLRSDTGTYRRVIPTISMPICDSIRYTVIVEWDNSCRCQDSLQLVMLSDATTKQRLWHRNWIRTNPIHTWDGIVLTPTGCVQQINLRNNFLNNDTLTPLPNLRLKSLQRLDLSGNELVGKLPAFNHLDSLQELYLDHNQFSSIFPLLQLNQLRYLYFDHNRIDSFQPQTRTQLPQLMTLQADYNRLTFDDLLPNLSVARNRFTYANQDSIFGDCIVTKEIGSRVQVSLCIDSAVTSSTYKWFKGNTWLRDTNCNQLIINILRLQDTGVYTCRVTNDSARGLTLFSRRIRIRAACAIPDIDTTVYICQGESYLLRDRITRVSTQGIYSVRLPNGLGCDTLVNTHLVVRPTDSLIVLKDCNQYRSQLTPIITSYDLPRNGCITKVKTELYSS
jgi:Leucine-rich repeat (LRR) protein